MTTRKPKPAEPASDLTKREVYAALAMAGIFAGPAGFAILHPEPGVNPEDSLRAVANAAALMADVMADVMVARFT